MKKLIMNTARTENGYCCSCNLLPGWIVSSEGDFDTFKKDVQESINFYISCAQKDGDSYSEILDEEYELSFEFL